MISTIYHAMTATSMRTSFIANTHLSSNARSRGPFKPRSTNQGKSSYQLRQFAEQTLGSGSLRKATKLPEGEDLNEWLAVNGMETTRLGGESWVLKVLNAVVDFYNQINLLYGSITEFCSPQTCPVMNATDEYALPLSTNSWSNR